MRKETTKQKKKEGVWEEFYFNGQLKIKGNYKDGKMERIWEFNYSF